MNDACGEEEGYDTPDGADGEAFVVVALEDDGDFFFSICWVLLSDLVDELYSGLTPFWLVLPESCSCGQWDAVLQVCDLFFVSVECCAGDVADFCAGEIVESLVFEFFHSLIFPAYIVFGVVAPVFAGL